MTALPLGFVRMPNVTRLNRVLAQAGYQADVITINCNAGLPFGRRSTSEEMLRYSVRTTTQALWLPDCEDGMPMLTSVGFSPAPQNIPNDQLVADVQGAGFLMGENPHRECLALVGDAEHSIDLALAIPFADAPAAYLVYADQQDDTGNWVVLTGCIMGIWHRLVGDKPLNPLYGAQLNPPEDALVGRTLAALDEQIQAHELLANPNKLWVFISPAASEGFRIDFDRSRAKRLSQIERDLFVHDEWVLNRDNGALEQISYLNLRGWFYQLFLTHGVPPENIGILNHNTVGSDHYTSKRSRVDNQAGVEIPRQATPNDDIPSNALVGVVRRMAQ